LETHTHNCSMFICSKCKHKLRNGKAYKNIIPNVLTTNLGFKKPRSFYV